ncbi:MAG: Gfo/Idh/MocA family oxidoreductase [Pirellulales bacterium]|nr:Gfo/Idh/MocA family oxidoreductase [Pirellulales bacterium]
MPLRFGLLGMWHTHAHGLVRQLALHPQEFCLLGCFDPDPAVAADRYARWKQLLPELRLCSSPEELLALPLDAVAVEGVVTDNVRWGRLALESGRPVLLEKPAGTSYAQFEALLELARQRRLHVQMAYLFRYMSAVVRLRQLAAVGALGRIYHFSARLPKDYTLYAEYVAELGRYGGGIFFEMAGHVVDLAVALLGPPRRVVSLLCHHHSQPGTFIDNGLALLEFEHALGTIEVSALETAPDSRRIEVFGTAGAAVIPHLGSGHLKNDAVQPIEVYLAGRAGWHRETPPAQTLHICDLREFAAVVAGSKPPEFSMEHDLAVQRTLLEACHML